MTEEQRQQRAALIREQPILWLFLLYAVAFASQAIASDVVQLASGAVPPHLQNYLLPLAVVLPMWLGLRTWARRVRVGPGMGDESDRSPFSQG